MNQNLIIALIFLAIAVASYLLGSINFAIIFTWAFKKKDIRDYGSGNAGLTNVVRSTGKLPALLTLIFDLTKCFTSILLGYVLIKNISWFGCDRIIDPIYGKYIAGFFCFLGHIFPIYYRFRGGKGVLTLLAVGLACNIKISIICLSIFILIFIIGRIVSIASVIAVFSVPFAVAVFPSNYITEGQFLIPQHTFEIIMLSLFSIIIILKHIPNMKRLAKGEEKRLSFNK